MSRVLSEAFIVKRFPTTPVDHDAVSADGLGAFFYPISLIITEKKRVTYQDSELSKPASYGIRKIVLDHILQDNTRIAVTDDGFVGIFNNSTEDVLDILNTIFATGITFGVGSTYGREKDLCKFTLIGDGTCIQLYELPNNTRVQSERNMFSFQRDDDSKLDKWRRFKLLHKVTSIQNIKKVLDRSYDYLAIMDSKKSVYKDLLLALEGYGLYYGEAHKGAYLHGWMIIETIIDQIWKEHVNTLRISSDDKKKLKESSQWTSHHHIEMLFALNKLDLTNRNFLTKLRTKRNDVIHKRKNVDPDEAHWCLRLAMVMILNRMLGNANIFHDPKGNALVQMWNCSKEEE